MSKVKTKTLAISLPKITSALLYLLIAVLLLAIFAGVIKTFLDLQLLLTNNLGDSLRQIILDALIVLAVIEVLRTANGYLLDGRVRVTFIVDTVLIVMLNEAMSLWFKGTNLTSTITLAVIILVLIIVRILAIRFSPNEDE